MWDLFDSVLNSFEFVESAILGHATTSDSHMQNGFQLVITTNDNHLIYVIKRFDS